MKTVTVKVDDLTPAALEWAGKNLTPLSGKQSGRQIMAVLLEMHGPTVEVPAELMEDKA